MEDNNQPVDVVLVGAGIMSATLGVLLKELEPSLTITIYEKLDVVAGESSDAWNNAGTGHSAFCELNYTPENEDGSIDVSKALKIAQSFEVSKAFWSYLVEQQYFYDPQQFINRIAHHSFVWNDDNVAYLKKRHEAMTQYALFEDMQFSDDFSELKTWFPLMMNGRDENQKVAATRMNMGTDIDFGALTRVLFAHLEKLDGVQLHLNHEVRDLEKEEDGTWNVKVKDLKANHKFHITTKFVFLGAGGGALPLLDKSDIEESKGYGGFPISGQWLVCNNEEVIAHHHAKVYGKASVGSPPMSVPHLDTRIIDGKQALLFGPFAGFSTKFLKHGSYFDLPASIELDNFIPMISAGLHNLSLTKYLIEQVTLSIEDKVNMLREYYPNAKDEDWDLAIAGQRVQVIKKDEKEGGILEFGTEVICAADGSLACLLGASPGASTSVKIMIDVLTKCFAEQMNTESWQNKLKEMIPFYGQSLKDDADLCRATRERTTRILELQ
ncbi:MAG: malate:quinone oxidoreductase [Chitinophagales bacterium]